MTAPVGSTTNDLGLVRGTATGETTLVIGCGNLLRGDDAVGPVLVRHLAALGTPPGVRLAVSAASGEPTSPYCPWWSLPETIRAAALCFERSGNRAVLEVWRTAHEAFFGTYWRGEPAIAYQTMTTDGPVDFVPATPDLDPGYHTGLSLLAAIEAARRMGANGALTTSTGA